MHAPNTPAATPRHHAAARRWPLAITAMATATAALLVACGGGGGSSTDAGAPTTSTQSVAFTEGTVSGFGSIIVNGVRFDDSAVQAVDDNGKPGVVKLGMHVEVQSGSVDSSSRTAKAHAVMFGSRVLGPVEAVGTNSITVLGQVVDVVDATVFDSTLSGGLSAVTVGAVIEVHGLPDATTGHLLATRVELETGVTAYKLRGTVAALDTTAKTFTIGGAVVNYGTATDVPAALANGSVVRVLLSTAKNASGQWVATSMGTAKTGATDGQSAHLRGTITALTDATHFTVNGLAVNASSASSMPSGLAVGSEVEVTGTVSGGVLMATAVSVETETRGHDAQRFELHGAITSIDSATSTFVLRGVTVNYAGAIYTGGAAADLAAGKRVEVRGTPDASRTKVTATTIKFE